jgi:hypothetical protein
MQYSSQVGTRDRIWCCGSVVGVSARHTSIRSVMGKWVSCGPVSCLCHGPIMQTLPKQCVP